MKLREVEYIGTIAQVCTAWRRIVAESPDLYRRPLRSRFSAAEIADADRTLGLAHEGITVPADARTLYLACHLQRNQIQIQQLERTTPRYDHEHEQEVLGCTASELRDATRTLDGRQAALKAARHAKQRGAIDELWNEVRQWRRKKDRVQMDYAKLQRGYAARNTEIEAINQRMRILRQQQKLLSRALCWARLQALGPDPTPEAAWAAAWPHVLGF